MFEVLDHQARPVTHYGCGGAVVGWVARSRIAFNHQGMTTTQRPISTPFREEVHKCERCNLRWSSWVWVRE